ncbi:hypothetical protein AQUSIP_05310 [Aquicella siphonis]|uniref:Uncharacterized protein n=1 Tax=Aquicella siphonis TaxID=254247 RepID=A0A5E4PFT1_9COXI|nr:hypothetical protein [Aquicella siphonis]VVC75243.1 hypothetical protein AQUSIP_05310 [Aquicella siphonis]
MSNIHTIIEFLYLNADFFSVTFNADSNKKFQAWAENNAQMIAPLSDEMHKAFLRGQHTTYYMTIAEFRIAMFGDGRHVQGLLDGSPQAMQRFLMKNPRVANTLLKHMQNPVIQKWYEEQATAQQRVERKARNQDIESGEFWRILDYQAASVRYHQYLQNEIAQEVNKISNEETLSALYKTLFNKTVDVKILQHSQIAQMKRGITAALIRQYGARHANEADAKVEQVIGDNIKLSLALKKHRVMHRAVTILRKPAQSRTDVLKKFHQHITANRDLLATRRDTGFVTFVKGLGVAAATIFGVVIGGYFAYQGLFGANATNGKMYMNEIKAISAAPRRTCVRG